jgi:hypothetical protein
VPLPLVQRIVREPERLELDLGLDDLDLRIARQPADGGGEIGHVPDGERLVPRERVGPLEIRAEPRLDGGQIGVRRAVDEVDDEPSAERGGRRPREGRLRLGGERRRTEQERRPDEQTHDRGQRAEPSCHGTSHRGRAASSTA